MARTRTNPYWEQQFDKINSFGDITPDPPILIICLLVFLIVIFYIPVQIVLSIWWIARVLYNFMSHIIQSMRH